MKARYRTLKAAGGAALICCCLAGQHSPRPNRHPLLAIFPDPLPDGRTSLSFEASSQFLRPDFEVGDRGRTFIRIDGEEWGLTLDLARRFGPLVLNLRLRGVWRSGGLADQAMASWHSLLGTDRGGRGMSPKFRLDYTLMRDDLMVARLAKDRMSFMDTDLAVLFPFGDLRDGARVGVSVQAPTGSRDAFSGSGGWDGLLGAAGWKSFGRFRIHAQLEHAFLGINGGNPYSAVIESKAQKRAWGGVSYQGGGRGFWGGLGLDATVGYTESPYRVKIPRVDRPGWQQHWTFSHARFPKWRVGISEEAGTYLSPDLTLFAQYRIESITER